MSKRVMLSICGRQAYLNQEPDVIELVTEGELDFIDGGWNISYMESGLTGLDGVNTTFRVEPEKVVLTRTGKLHSQMIFEQGISHESLYQMEFGALMITVIATRISVKINEDGGCVDLTYQIDVEHSAAGTVDYHLEIRPIN